MLKYRKFLCTNIFYFKLQCICKSIISKFTSQRKSYLEDDTGNSDGLGKKMIFKFVHVIRSSQSFCFSFSHVTDSACTFDLI